jgi:hypothetical protein
MFKFNGEIPRKIFFNGKKVAKVVYRTFTVWVDKVLQSLATNSGNIRYIPFYKAVKEPLDGLSVYGHSYQSSTPTPETPIEISTTGILDSATGKYKIPCFLGSDKVIANYDAIPTSYTTSSGYITRDGSTITLTNTTTSATAIGLEVKLKDIFPELKVGDTIMFDMKTNGVDHIWLKKPGLVERGGVFTITQDVLNSYLNLYTQYSGTLTATITELSYYKTVKDYSVLLDEPLRRIYNDDFCDYIDFANKTVVRQCGSLKLTGQEDGWYINGNYTKNNIICLTNTKQLATYNPSYSGGLCNKFVHGASEKVNTFRFSSNIYLFFSLDATKYTLPEDIVAVKMTDELRNVIAGTEIIYIRQTPIEEPIDMDDIVLEDGDNMASVFYDNDSAPLIKNIKASYYKYNEEV